MKRVRIFSFLYIWAMGLFFLMTLISQGMGAEKKPARVTEKKPITIGLLYGITGFAAVYNKPAIAGHELAQAEINERGGVLGRPIRYILKDTQTKPDVGARMAKELILKDKVDFLMGTLSSAEGLAVSQVAKEHKILFIATIPKSDRITEDMGHRYVFRIASNTTIEGRAVAELEKNTPNMKYYTLANDYEYGRMVVEAFVDRIKKIKPGAEIVGQSWPKLGEMEYTPYITTILAAKPDAVINFVYGGMAVAMIKQANPYGFFDKVKFITGAEVVSTEMAEPLGKEMPEGIWGNAYDIFYWPDTPEHKRWTKAYLDKTGERYVPGWAIQGYLGTYFLVEAIKKAKKIDTEAVIDALEGLTIKSPIGPITIRKYDHQANRGQIWGKTKFDPNYGFTILEEIKYIGAEGLWHTEEEIKVLREKAQK
jgi:branched-chain amino acid transport system substrate-binding protein